MSTGDIEAGEPGGHDGFRRVLARQAIESGRLPIRRRGRIWGGPGQGAKCTVCGLPVDAGELGYEVEFAENDASWVNHHLHIPCFAAWESESRLAAQGTHDEAGTAGGRANGNGSGNGNGHAR